jgi:hypothetical protein
MRERRPTFHPTERATMRKKSGLAPSVGILDEQSAPCRHEARAGVTSTTITRPAVRAVVAQDGAAAVYATVLAAWRRGDLEWRAPGPTDHVVLVRGMPVAPWMRLKPMEDVWAAWLSGLRARWLSWQDDAGAATSGASTQVAEGWDTWQSRHVHALQFRRAELGAERLAELLADKQMASGEAHLVGHSVGGATLLRYLAGVRAGDLPAPAGRVHAAITLDAALTGIAGLWSGMRSYLDPAEHEAIAGLGAWARQHGIALITICNERDIWSHRAIDDLPYVGFRLGPPLDVGAQLNGAIHGWLRRMPQVVAALWLDAAALPAYTAELGGMAD